MSKFFHGFLHVLAIVLQIVNVSAVPAPYQTIVAAVVGAAQTALALSQHQAPKAP